MKSVTVISAHLDQETDQFHVVKFVEQDDGTSGYNLHTFGRDILEWRAAEHDTSDLDTLIDIVLYEDLVGDGETPRAAKARLAKASKPSKAQNVAGLRAAGIHQTYIDAAANDPYESIKQHAHFQPEVVEIKREFLARRKAQQALATAEKERQPTAAERSAKFREALLGNRREETGRSTHKPGEDGRPAKLPPIVLGANKHVNHSRRE